MPCSEISADWAAQRIKGLSLIATIRNALLASQVKQKGDVIKTLIDTIIIVIIVIYLFIGSFRSVLVPVAAIPLSLIGACGLMLLFGFTINLLTPFSNCSRSGSRGG